MNVRELIKVLSGLRQDQEVLYPNESSGFLNDLNTIRNAWIDEDERDVEVDEDDVNDPDANLDIFKKVYIVGD